MTLSSNNGIVEFGKTGKYIEEEGLFTLKTFKSPLRKFLKTKSRKFMLTNFVVG